MKPTPVYWILALVLLFLLICAAVRHRPLPRIPRRRQRPRPPNLPRLQL